MCARVLCLKLTVLADVHLLACEAHVARPHQRVAVADCACHVWVLDNWLLLCILLLDRDWNLFGNLRLYHLNEELLMLSVHAASALAATAWVRSTLLSLPSITAETRDGLCQKLLVHELLILTGKLLDLDLVLVDVSSLLHGQGC